MANNVIELKVILVGDSGVGKTSLINSCSGQKFNESEEPTISGNYVIKNLKIDGKEYKVNLWDTAGQEKYRHLTKLFYKGSSIIFFVYDITNEKSFESLPIWIKEVKDVLGSEAILGLVGNKKDLYLNELVKEKTGIDYAKEHGMEFKLTSAKTDPDGLNELLESLVKKVKVKKNAGFNIDKKHSKEGKNCGC